MNKLKFIAAATMFSCSLLAPGSTFAALYNYTGVATLCSSTCASFASLDVGSTINGQFEIDTTPGGSFGDADMVLIDIDVFNPALPPSGSGGDVLNDNPMVLDSTLGIIASNGTAGTTDASNEINSGQMLLEALLPPLSSNGLFLIFDLSTGNGQMCVFFATAGCIPGATEVSKFEGEFSLVNPVPIPAAIWLFGTALIGLVGFSKRRKAA